MLKTILNFYIIDAMKIASEVGLGNRINMVMQAVFLKLANVIPVDEALNYLKKSIEDMYGRKGEAIVEMNIRAVDRAIAALVEIEVPPTWATEEDEDTEEMDVPDFVKNIQVPMARHEGDELPVSALCRNGRWDLPLRYNSLRKTGNSSYDSSVAIEKCIQCGRCSYVCPHAIHKTFPIG